MAQTISYSIRGLDLYSNPLNQPDGQVIRAVNVDSDTYQAKSKRLGYTTYNSSFGTQVVDLFTWRQEGGTAFWNYASAGGTLFYSTQGTSDWQVCGNGTITSGSHIGNTVLANTLLISQNGGTTRHTTNGTSFIDTSLAPAGELLAEYQNRVYITGSSSDLFFSTTNDPTNWQTSGTSDSSSIVIPGAGDPNKIWKLNNRLMVSKNQQSMFRWDGYTLQDMATNMGLSSTYAFGTVEDNAIYLNRLGIATTNGDQPTLISNPIQKLIYNNAGSGIQGSLFDTTSGVIHRYDYIVSAGTITDDFTNETINNAVIDYNYQKNEFTTYSLADNPTTFNSYRDYQGNQQLLFGDSTGQVYQLGGNTDNGKPIEVILEMVFFFNAPQSRKNWKGFWGFFNPGCNAQIMYATSDTFLKEDKNWTVLGDATSGGVFYRFPKGSRSRFLYIKVVDSSRNTPFEFYGLALDADPIVEI